jgi:phenylacetate-coenzyme A ligase PaaK-like adenylate-forming protein
MNFDFSSYPLRLRSYSEQPMAFLDMEPKATLASIMEIALIETGNRSAREHWQQQQLRNLLKHAGQRSAFWRKRIGDSGGSHIDLASLPVLKRQDLRQQVESEGPLLRRKDSILTKARETSGSSGVPVRFFASSFNARYNVVRTATQYFMEGRDLHLNHTRMIQTDSVAEGFLVETTPTWHLLPFIKSGTGKRIKLSTFARGRESYRKLIEELMKDDIGYFACSPRHIELLLNWFDLEFLRKRKTAMWIPYGEHVDPHLVKTFAHLSIPIRGNYSSEEVGLIGTECAEHPGYYHVATSNVIVEVVDQSHEVDGFKLGKILVTHLHSYATPLIRYDLDDLGCVQAKCPCGHDGPAIYRLQGRSVRLLKHRDGRLSPFYVVGEDLAALAQFTEFRIRQTAFDKLVIEVGGRSELKADEVSRLEQFLSRRAGPDFQIDVKACEQIDWGSSIKRPGFRREI